MAIRYTPEDLNTIRNSPLCSRPERLPPAEEWMGPTNSPEQIRAQTARATQAQPRTNDNALPDQANRRPGFDRHTSRNHSNTEDVVFGPPRTNFTSRGGKNNDHDHDGRRQHDSQDQFMNSPMGQIRRRRNEGEQESDSGWTSVKPRKSFGSEGAERFAGRMGNFRDSKQPQRERDDKDATRERSVRLHDNKDRQNDSEGRPRNGLGRNKSEPWAGKTDGERPEPTVPNNERREAIERASNWRDNANANASASRGQEDRRNNNRNKDRRWGRDDQYRQDESPEWAVDSEPRGKEARTQQDFAAWMESMKKSKQAHEASEQSRASAAETSIQAQKPAVQSAPAVEHGPDKFFLAHGFSHGSNAGLDVASPGAESPSQQPKPKAQPRGSSKFASFFSSGSATASPAAEDPHARAEPPPSAPNPLATFGLGGLANALPPQGAPQHGHSAHASFGSPTGDDRAGFNNILAKLKQSATGTPDSNASPFTAPSQQPQQQQQPQQPPQPQQQHSQQISSKMTSPEPFQQYMGGERRDGPMAPPGQQNIQEILSPRPQQHAARPDQLLQDLVGHHRRVSSQTSQRADQQQHQHQPKPVPDTSRNNSNTEFLMNLMRGTSSQQPPLPQQHQHQPPQGNGPQGPSQYDQQMLRMLQQQQSKSSPMAQQQDREPDYQRERGSSQGVSRSQHPPGYGGPEEPFHHTEGEQRQPSHPTQILQRPPPPGLDQMAGQHWMPGGQMSAPPPPSQRGGHMMPPPGLQGGPGPSRNMPMQHMFPPNFPPGSMPPPPEMGGMPGPPRNMPPGPPPGFFNGLPPGFMGPGGENGFNGPLSGDFPFPGGMFDAGRGMPPLGNGGRGAFGRQ